MNVLFIAAIAPAVVLLWYVYKKDAVEKEPLRLVLKLFCLGMVAGPLAAIVENIAFALFESVLPEGTVLLALEYFVGVAAVEEGFKYLFLHTVRKRPEFDYVFDGIVYAVAVALGFAALENLLYVFDGGFEVAVSRAIFSVPGHCADGVVMGAFFGLAKQREVRGRKAGARTYYILAFLIPTIEHGFYDSFLSADNDTLAIIALLGQLAFIAYAMYLVNRVSKNDSPIYGVTRMQALSAMGASVVPPAYNAVETPIIDVSAQPSVGQEPDNGIDIQIK